MNDIALQAVQMQSAGFTQSIGTAVARQQIDAQKAVASLVAETASPPASAGQGRLIDIRV